MTGFRLTVATMVMFASGAAVVAQTKSYPLESASGLTLVNAKAEPVTHEGRRAVLITISDDAARNVRSGIEVNPQYISRPEWPWPRLRKETPEKYEAYVDLVPGAWT